jgi:hypothetical protein
MARKQVAKKKEASIDLFLKKRKKQDLPKRGVTLTPIDYKAIQKAADRYDKYQLKLDEIHYPLYKSQLKKIGITKDQWEEIGAQEDALYEKYQEEIKAAYVPQAFPLVIDAALCRQVTVWECQEKVCVDQPIPFDVDEFWFEGGSNVSNSTGPSFNGNHVDYYVSSSNKRKHGFNLFSSQHHTC